MSDDLYSVCLRVAARLGRVRETIDEEVGEALDDAVPVRTGALRASREMRVGEDTTEHVFTKVYAAVVEFGRTAFAPFPGRFYVRSVRRRMGSIVSRAVRRAKEEG